MKAWRYYIFLSALILSSMGSSIRAEVFFEEIAQKHRQRLIQLFSEGHQLIDISFNDNRLLYTFDKNGHKFADDFFLKIFHNEKKFLEGVEFYKKQQYLVQAMAYKEDIGFAVFFIKANSSAVNNFELVKIPFDAENVYSVQMFIRLVNDQFKVKKIPAANTLYENYLYQCFRRQSDYGFDPSENLKFSMGRYKNAKEMHQDLLQVKKQGRQLTAFSNADEEIFTLFVYR